MRLTRPGFYPIQIYVDRVCGDVATPLHTEVVHHPSTLRHPKDIANEAIRDFKLRVKKDPALLTLFESAVKVNHPIKTQVVYSAVLQN